MIETDGLSLKEFQGEKEIQLVVLVIKKTEIGEVIVPIPKCIRSNRQC